MVPEILIVGDDVRRGLLVRRVGALGYSAVGCGTDDLDERLREGAAPAAIMVCAVGADAAALMAQLRRNRHGAAVPVTLCGRLGGAIRDLADVLDLGADHFLEEPISDDSLGAAPEGLAGAPRGNAPGPAVPPAPPPTAAPLRTEVISTVQVPIDGSASGTGSGRVHRDPSIGQLGRTLDMLEEKIRSRRDAPRPDESADDMELSMLGLDAVPEVDGVVGVDDPAESGPEFSLGEAARSASFRTPAPSGRTNTAPDSTILLEGGQQAASLERSSSDGSASWRDFSTGRLSFDEVHDPSSRVIHDRPRRTTPLTVDREGRLENVEVPRLLWKLHRAHYTGRLDLRRGRVEKRVWLVDGRIVFARSNIGYDRLIDGLLRRGLLSREQYTAARRLASKEPRRAGQLLVESGFLKDVELAPAIREHLLRIVDSTFPWVEGTWELVESARCEEAVQLDRNAVGLLLTGIAYRMEAAQLWALLGGPRQHPRLSPGVASGRESELAHDLGLGPNEDALLGALDGRSDLGALTRRRGVDEQRALALVYGLHVIELVDLVAEALPADATLADPASLDRARVLDRLEIVRESDYFAVLGLPRDATRLDVRRAHKTLTETYAAEELEPSVVASLGAETDEIAIALEEAARILEDDDLRNAYLAHLEAE